MGAWYFLRVRIGDTCSAVSVRGYLAAAVGQSRNRIEQLASAGTEGTDRQSDGRPVTDFQSTRFARR